MNGTEVKSQDTSAMFWPVGHWDSVITLMEGDQVIEREFRQGDTFRTEDPTQVATSDINQFIAFQFSVVPEVECVYTAFRENHVFYVWIVIDRWEKEVRRRIYQQQQAVIDQFPEFCFDFYIVPREGERVEDLISQSIDLAYVRPPHS